MQIRFPEIFFTAGRKQRHILSEKSVRKNSNSCKLKCWIQQTFLGFVIIGTGLVDVWLWRLLIVVAIICAFCVTAVFIINEVLSYRKPGSNFLILHPWEWIAAYIFHECKCARFSNHWPHICMYMGHELGHYWALNLTVLGHSADHILIDKCKKDVTPVH